MKVTLAQLQGLFQALGVAQAVEIVNSVEESDKDFNADNLLKNFADSKEPIYLAKFNETILPEKIKAVAGEFGGKLNGYIRKASDNQIPLSDLETLSDQDKIVKLVELLNSNKGKDTEELRKQITETIEKHTSEVEKIKSEYEQKITASESRFFDVQVSDFIQNKLLSDIPLIDGDAKIRAGLLKSALSEKYHLVFNDKNELELRDKENKEAPVIDKEKNAIYQPKQFATEFFTGLGIVKNDNRQEPTRSDKDNPSGSQKSSFRGGIDEATSKALDEL